MAEYPREYPGVHKQTVSLSSNSGSLDPVTAPNSWLEELDITNYDFPYLEPLLKSGFSVWASDALPIEDLEESEWFVTDHTGELVEGTVPGLNDKVKAAKRAVELALARGAVSTAEYEGVGAVAVPVRTKRSCEIFAALVCVGLSSIDSLNLFTAQSKFFRSCFYRALENLFVVDLLILRKQANREAKRRAALFRAVQRLHDKINVDAVLTEVFDIMTELYPKANIELLMSQDHPSRDSRIRSLRFEGKNSSDKLSVRAFMEATLLKEEVLGEDGPILEVAVPLVGKQGAYGVLLLTVSKEAADDIDLQLINILADTAGTAFENARLYEQSNLLIHELRLINELAQQINRSLRLEEVFKFTTDELIHIFKAEYCCLSQLDRERDQFKIMASNVPALNEEPFPSDYGFCGLVLSTREPVILSDYKKYGKVKSKMMDVTGARSLIAAPVFIRGEVNGTIMLAHRNAHYFSYDNYKLLQVLASHIGLAVANASLHAEVQLMADRDMLTGLYARHYLDDVVQGLQKQDESGTLIIVDIDYFKQVNDTFGHQSGDRVLRQVCDIVRSTIRDKDIAARWGGEELAVYLPGMRAEEGALVAEMIRESIYMNTKPQVSVSCGVADWTSTDAKISVEALFYRADMALYRAKNGGRNRVEVADLDEDGTGISKLYEREDIL
ncbi:GGDEF domain-containing protein [Paenibacillus sp. CAA11]|nr:GGDEF domain-containing protein [Paenibacillus sp. CAA11]